MSSEAVIAGSAVVAEAKITVGPQCSPESGAYRAHKRSRRRSTIATLEPKIPR